MSRQSRDGGKRGGGTIVETKIVNQARGSCNTDDRGGIQKLSETWKGGHGYIVRDETRSVEDPKPVFNRATARISCKQQGGLAFSAGAKYNHNKKSAPRNKRTLLDVLSSWVCARGRYQEGLRAKSSTTADVRVKRAMDGPELW
ncbi:predicted protein [Histoplasma capsulatum G186AR]|uniref:Uncharacterized protein n=1 Tax=Ajellomyces capsulatus (strain G186AR / H82 / ATCC MYA-2454 / RMSCC 2432) TaxID=447093 RepID=C0NJD9_AJECG|nr:uncharacterized protein HCBG_03269 [Histoplasma capsulatum G186AR]EEH07980.1 predicted protein [Histoplasma capsulatum G186AR]